MSLSTKLLNPLFNYSGMVIIHFFLSLFFWLLLILPGLAWLTRHPDYTPLEKFVIAPAIGMTLYGVLGVISACLPIGWVQIANLILLGLVSIISWIYLDKKDLKKILIENKVFIGVFTSFILFLQIFVALPFRMPTNLYDGPYVFKNHNLNVKIQALTGNLPADNYIPFAFSEYLRQRISFTENRPQLPGQEVTNRTVLLGLNAYFFSAIPFAPPAVPKTKIDTYYYSNHEWPDVGQFSDNEPLFHFFLDFSWLANALFLSAIYLLLHRLFGYQKALGGILILLILPFTLSQTIFTWPKFLMAYFLITGLYLVLFHRQHWFMLSFILALAYHSHPSALIYIGSILLYYLIKELFKHRLTDLIKPFAKILGVLALLILPWFIWCRFIVNIPSDLILQNIVSESYNFWFLVDVRLKNLYQLFFPYLPQSGMLLTTLATFWTVTIPGTTQFYFIFSYYLIIRYFKTYWTEIVILFFLPLILLTIVWGKVMGAYAILFGQPVVPLMVAFPLILFASFRWFSGIMIGLNLCLSIFTIWFGFYHIPTQSIETGTWLMIGGLMGLQIFWAIWGYRQLTTDYRPVLKNIIE